MKRVQQGKVGQNRSQAGVISQWGWDNRGERGSTLIGGKGGREKFTLLFPQELYSWHGREAESSILEKKKGK